MGDGANDLAMIQKARPGCRLSRQAGGGGSGGRGDHSQRPDGTALPAGLYRQRDRQKLVEPKPDIDRVAAAIDQHQFDFLAGLGVGLTCASIWSGVFTGWFCTSTITSPGREILFRRRAGGIDIASPPRPAHCRAILNLARAGASSAPSDRAQLRRALDFGLGAGGGSLAPGLSGLASRPASPP